MTGTIYYLINIPLPGRRKAANMAERQVKRKKKGKTVNFLMDIDVLKATDDYCAMTGINRTEVVEKALSRYIAPYRTNDGKPPVKATYLTDIPDGKGGKVSVVRDCYILGSISRDGKEMLRIYSEDGLSEVPKESVRIISSDD